MRNKQRTPQERRTRSGCIMKWRDTDLARDGADMHYAGPIYVRPIGRGVVLTGLELEPQLDEVLDEGEYFAEIRILRWPIRSEDVPEEVLKAGMAVFKTFERLREWLNEPVLAGSWAPGGATPAELIQRGKKEDIVGALVGLANGNFL